MSELVIAAFVGDSSLYAPRYDWHIMRRGVIEGRILTVEGS